MIVGRVMSQLTSLLGPLIIFLIINSMVVCIASSCLLVTDSSATFYLSIPGFILYSFSFITLIVASSKAFETAKETSSKFLYRLAVSACCDGTSKEDDVRRQMIASQMMILNSLEGNVRMAPLGLFYLVPSYILRFFAVMLSYSVILIQTSGSVVSEVIQQKNVTSPL